MIKANVILDYSKWKNKIKNPNIYLNKKLRKLSKIVYSKKKTQEFSILLTNNKKMKNLNFKFRKKNKPTDVLFVKRIENSCFFLLKKGILDNFLSLFLK